jgi:predicted outer membrane lipoprotein
LNKPRTAATSHKTLTALAFAAVNAVWLELVPGQRQPDDTNRWRLSISRESFEALNDAV